MFKGIDNRSFVSTHSRPKAAGHQHQPDRQAWLCFNTQPPEGGWNPAIETAIFIIGFQHTAARRRLVLTFLPPEGGSIVSTHSRPKAAGCVRDGGGQGGRVSTHSRPKAAGFDGALFFG